MSESLQRVRDHLKGIAAEAEAGEAELQDATPFENGAITLACLASYNGNIPTSFIESLKELQSAISEAIGNN